MNTENPNDEMARGELVHRIELMERMIAEGRRAAMCRGWIFVLWGVADLAGMGWQQVQSHSRWVWPVCLGVALAAQLLGLRIQQRGRKVNRGVQCSSLNAVWSMMGLAMFIYVGTALLTNFAWQYSYLAALLMIMGLAHAISAVILRWRVQGVVAGIWWAGAVTVLVLNSRRAANAIFLIEMCFGMIAFGLYIMMLERRNRGERSTANA